MHLELKYTAQRSGRLSSFLREEMKLSSGLMNRLKWQEKLLVNGKPEHTDFQVQPGDEITVLMDAPQLEYPAEDGDLTIIYEDAYILAVEKPAGMLIHPSRVKNDGTLANFVAGYYEKTGQKCAFHPVTRLDRDTFGIVLLAKNAHIHALLQNTKVQKTYHALVFGRPENDSGVIDAPIDRRPAPSLLRFVGEQGKPSVTAYRVMEYGNGYTKLELRPITGRTHQLRVHCAYKGFPILGDPQYGSEVSWGFSARFRLNYQQLCAYGLELIHPITGEKLFLHSQMDVIVLSAGDEI